MEENEDLAEMIGIILGDGHLYEKQGHYRLTISFSIEEKKYIEYVKNLMQKIFQITPQYSERVRPGRSSARLRITRKKIVRTLISKGLKAGDKVKNQVGVPEWIKENIKYNLSCLRGLLDTDGTIAPVKLYKIITIGFSSASIPLVNDFREMCNSLDIRTSKVIGPIRKLSEITGKLSKQYNVQIQAKDQVKKFIELVKPKKWENRSQSILRAINKTYDEAFSYVKSPYDLKQAEKWKMLLEKKGSIKKIIIFLKDKGEFVPTESSFKIWMEKLLTAQGYQKWLKFNTNILIDEQNLRIQQFPQQLRVFLCKKIDKLLKINKKNDVNTILDNLISFIDGSAVLKRVGYLLNDSRTENIIQEYLKKLILLVQATNRQCEANNKLSITKLKQELNLPFHRKDIMDIVEMLKQNKKN